MINKYENWRNNTLIISKNNQNRYFGFLAISTTLLNLG